MGEDQTKNTTLCEATPEYLTLLGSVTFEYAKLESNLRTAAGVMIFLEGPLSNLTDAIFGQMGVGQIIEMIERLYHARIELRNFDRKPIEPAFADKLQDKFSAAIDLTRKAQTLRNVFAHSSWTREATEWNDIGGGFKVPIDDPSKLVLTRTRLTRNTAKRAEQSPANIEELAAAVDAIKTATEAVVEFKAMFTLVYVIATMSLEQITANYQKMFGKLTAEQLDELSKREEPQTQDEKAILDALALKFQPSTNIPGGSGV